MAQIMHLYRSTPPAMGTLVNIRGAYCGKITGIFLYKNVTICNPNNDTMTNMLVVRANVQPGDSGASCFSEGLYGREAIGILSFGGYLDGVQVGVFINLQNM